jgi:hypothetical protein
VCLSDTHPQPTHMHTQTRTHAHTRTHTYTHEQESEILSRRHAPEGQPRLTHHYTVRRCGCWQRPARSPPVCGKSSVERKMRNSQPPSNLHKIKRRERRRRERETSQRKERRKRKGEGERRAMRILAHSKVTDLGVSASGGEKKRTS